MADSKISQLVAASTPLAGTEVLPIVQSSSTVKVTVGNVTAGRDVAVKTLAANTTLSAWVAPFDSLVELKDGVSMTSAYGIGFNPVNAYVGSGGWLYRNSSVASLYQNGAGAHEWSRAASGTAGAAVTWISQLKTDSSDNVTVPTGNLVIGTSAKGINFSANTGAAGMTSELLNWYEEGTWTPTVTSTVGALAGVTATGTYTRVGREVYITYNIVISANGTGLGAIKVDGLPYTLAQRGFGMGVESDTVGFAIYANAIAATTYALVTKIDGTYPGGTAYRLQGNFSYIV